MLGFNDGRTSAAMGLCAFRHLNHWKDWGTRSGYRIRIRWWWIRWHQHLSTFVISSYIFLQSFCFSNRLPKLFLSFLICNQFLYFFKGGQGQGHRDLHRCGAHKHMSRELIFHHLHPQYFFFLSSPWLSHSADFSFSVFTWFLQNFCNVFLWFILFRF